MKVVNKLCQILAIVFGLAALAIFFTADFATIVTAKQSVTLSGAQLAFGGSVNFGGHALKMAQSAHIWFCIIITILGVLFSALTFKFKSMRYAAPAAGLVSAVYMLVIALGSTFKFVDYRPIKDYATVLDIDYLAMVYVIVALLFLFVAFGIAHLLIDDKLAVAGTKKLTIPRRIVAFFRDYKSEVKKISWPNMKFVVKNTTVVLVICAIIGLFIWALDLGLTELLGLLLGA